MVVGLKRRGDATRNKEGREEVVPVTVRFIEVSLYPPRFPQKVVSVIYA
jgi:hypothetical protein